MTDEATRERDGTMPADPSESALRVEGLLKAYGATQALDGVSFTVAPGEVHAFLGGNGSGKSTAIKLLAGVVEADGGVIDIRGEEFAAKAMNPALARSLGLRFVHQQPPVFPMETIAENIALGFEFPRRGAGPIRWREVRERAEVAAERFRLDLDVTEPMSTLRPANQAMIAIVRALQDLHELGNSVLILDEPTAALPREEAQMLLDAVKKYAAEDLAVLFVTHRLEEVLQAADRATVLKDGKVAGVLGRTELSHDRLVEAIVGSTIESSGSTRRKASDRARARLTVDSLKAGPIKDVCFDVAEGEVVGIAGLLGSGRSSLLRTLFGIDERQAGAVELDGESVEFRNPNEAIAAGIAYIPEDRVRDALFHGMSVHENLSMVTTGDYWRRGWLHWRQEGRDARSLMGNFGIKAAGEEAMIGSLSGGNQQKVVLGRWIRKPVKVLLLDEPTQGVDVGARAEIFAAINHAASEGTAVVMVSSEFEELTLMCSRILVLRDGCIAAEIVEPSSDAMELERAVHERTEAGER